MVPFDRRLVAWMLVLGMGLALVVKLLTAPHEERIGKPKGLGLVATAVLFEARHERTPAPTDPVHPLDL